MYVSSRLFIILLPLIFPLSSIAAPPADLDRRDKCDSVPAFWEDSPCDSFPEGMMACSHNCYDIVRISIFLLWNRELEGCLLIEMLQQTDWLRLRQVDV